MDNETLQAIRELLTEQEHRINKRFDRLEEKLEEIKVTTGSIVDWIDEAEHAVEIRFPVRKKSS